MKLFRKIRRGLLLKGKFGNYLKYAMGEIILVVIGILIALSINNWNEQRKENNKRQDYYHQLLDDLNRDLKFTNSIINEFENYNQNYLNNLENYADKNVTLDKLYDILIKLKITSSALTFNSSTMESLLNSGDIGLIDPVLRNKLIDLKRLQELTIKRFDFTNEGKNQIVQNASLIMGSPQMQEKLKEQSQLQSLKMKNNMSKLILALEATHRWKYLSQIEAVDRLKLMQTELSDIIKIINKKVKK
ncbi:DUF6090 family protein [Gaetbulibacter aestuarii]|uniref:DUF6090 family protein n=1 Tax=Gaetbulibacter aestuarii TaxID=1502358 RepID=A0ABW7N1K2_9FLAO